MKLSFRATALGAILAMVSMAWTPHAFAQGQTVGPQPGGGPRFDGINAARDVTIIQQMDAQVPLDVPFRDEAGQRVTLRQYAGKKPIWLVMPFYKCTGTCSAMLNGMVSAMHDDNLRYQIGRDFEVVVVSINPKETADLAAAKKREYISELGIPGAENGWHFLTGEEANIKSVADAIGYKYVYNARLDQYAHASGTFVLTPSGHVSRYFFGVNYKAKDLRLAFTEAQEGKIGSAADMADRLLLFCYHYDPQRNTYGLYVFRIMQVFGTLTVLALGSFMVIAFRKEARDPRFQKGVSVTAGDSATVDTANDRQNP